MKCKQCGNEFEGKFCPECGAKTEAESSVQNKQSAPIEIEKPKKKKKPFYLRWWFILLAIIVIGIVALSLSGNSEKIVWDDIVLGDMLPEPPENRGRIDNNTAEELSINVNGLSSKQIAEYIEACKSKGFNVDMITESSAYSAYNKKGYKLSLDFYSDGELSIHLEVPMEMTTITWPTSAAGKMIPAPKSRIGMFESEYEDSFNVYVGNTTKSDFKEYIDTCTKKGFNVDYSKGENYYYADNSQGWHIDIDYEGNNIMQIYISAPSEDDSDEDVVIEQSKPTATDTEDIDPDFKEAMDSYEKFMDEYVSFMKKYQANPADPSLLADVSDYMSKYTEYVEDFENWEDEDLNTAEVAYYMEVQTRVNKKLLEVAG